jgi:WD40 repeat protein
LEECKPLPDGTRIASASDDGTVRVWDVGGGRVVAKLEGCGCPGTSCAWNPDGNPNRTLLEWDGGDAREAGAYTRSLQSST